MTASEGLSGYAVKWQVMGRLVSSRWCLGALAVVAGALGLTLLGWLFSPSTAAASELLPPIPVPALSVPGVATVTPDTSALPSVDVSPALNDVPLQAPVLSAAHVSVPVVLHAVHSVSKTVREVTGLVESVVAASTPEPAPGVAVAPCCSRQRVTAPVRHDVRSARVASIGAAPSSRPAWTVPASTQHQKPSPGRAPAFPLPTTPLNSSGVSGGHGGMWTVAILAAAHPTGPLAGPVRFVADQIGGDDNTARPDVTPD
jgi:hypothetical protein